MEQPTLFDNDPALRMRDSKGRFATPERARADKAIEENKYLRLEVEKYRRAYLAAGSMSARYHRELLEVKEQLKELLKKTSV
jgi:regulator of replication initiation timing